MDQSLYHCVALFRDIEQSHHRPDRSRLFTCNADYDVHHRLFEHRSELFCHEALYMFTLGRKLIKLESFSNCFLNGVGLNIQICISEAASLFENIVVQ